MRPNWHSKKRKQNSRKRLHWKNETLPSGFAPDTGPIALRSPRHRSGSPVAGALRCGVESWAPVSIEPPRHDCCDVTCRCKVQHELVIPCGNTPPILETARGALDDVPAAIGDWVKRLGALAGRVVGNDGFSAACFEKATKSVAIVSGIRSAKSARRQRFKQRDGDGSVTTLSRCYSQRDWTAATIDNSMDFCRSAAS